jgi:hypothetical protein
VATAPSSVTASFGVGEGSERGMAGLGKSGGEVYLKAERRASGVERRFR